MKKAITKTGSLRFTFEQRLTCQQIKGFFSRLAKNSRSGKGTQISNEDEEDTAAMDDDSQQLSTTDTTDGSQTAIDEDEDEGDDDEDDYDSGIQNSHSDALRSQIHDLLDPSLRND